MDCAKSAFKALKWAESTNKEDLYLVTLPFKVILQYFTINLEEVRWPQDTFHSHSIRGCYSKLNAQPEGWIKHINEHVSACASNPMLAITLNMKTGTVLHKNWYLPKFEISKENNLQKQTWNGSIRDWQRSDLTSLALDTAWIWMRR